MKIYKKQPIKASNKPAPRKRAIKAANEVYRNTNPAAFSQFLGEVAERVNEFAQGAEGTYDIKGSRFVDDEVVIYELMVRDVYDKFKEIGYVTIEQSADGFRAWRGDDEDTEFITGGSFDDILDSCVDECSIIIEDYENFQ